MSLPADVLRVGDTLRATVAAFDSAGRVVRVRTTRWETSDAGIASVSPAGVVVGVGPGVATISAVVDGARGAMDLQVVRPVTLSVAITPDSVAVPASVVVDLTAVARDVSGQPIVGIAPTWLSSAPEVASVGPTGRVTALVPGRTEITATLDGIVGRAVVSVTRPSNVRLASVAPTQLAPGATITITGAGFSTTRTSNLVTVGGVAATVRTATATQITATVATTGYACEPTRDVPVTVTVAGESGALPAALQVATQHAFARGQSLVLSDPALARCNEIVPATGRYLVAVFNPSTVLAAVPVTLRGAQSVTPPFAVDASLALVPSAVAAPLPPLATAAGAHARPLLVRSLARSDALAPAPAAPAAQLQAVGDTVTLHVLGATARSCSDATTDVRGRTVYVGRRVAVFEDVAAPLAGTMDDDYRRIGQEFDDVTYPMLESTFGSALAVDGRLARTGRVALLFTRQINDRPGILGVSLNCDLVPASAARASNEQAIVYLAVPTSAAAGLGDGRPTGTRDAWRRRIRAVAAHETKHVISYAERLARSAAFEEPWLEEGTALVAEELFARAVRSLPIRSNTTYRESLACELRPMDPGCADVPVAFSDHFARLYTTLSDPATLSPFVTDLSIDPTAVFYGSAWWLLRWSADGFGTSDAAFFRALVIGPQTGVDNLAARTGRPWGDLLGEWWLATAVDDLAGFEPQRATLSEPSWNLRDVFAGAQTSGDPRFGRAFPLAPRTASFGDFTTDVPSGIRGGGAAFVELSGPAWARQLLELRAPAGTAAPPLGIAIVRVQ
ncbi:MAG: IPT/TIG domain-containing protein [Gemmatirosa sp.]|nr:IPT/TIG domain-containing protein [Gemmatirosa sp.]